MSRPPLPPSAALRRLSTKQPLVGGQQEIAEIVQAVQAGRCARLIGPRYHHKSQIMRAACQAMDQLFGHLGLYVSLWDTRTASEAAFFASLRDQLAIKTSRYYKRRLAHPAIRSAADLTQFLVGLPEAMHTNVVLFVDDLNAAPAQLDELLKALRAAYQNTATGSRFLAVVCASHSLARTALGPTSPFENISRLVTLRDLTSVESRELARRLLENSAKPTAGALALIDQLTSGDRLLVSEICRECAQLMGAPTPGTRLTREHVRAAVEKLVRQGVHTTIAEGLQAIEGDPNLLLAILSLRQKGPLPASQLQLDLSDVPNLLLTSGFVSFRQGRYQIKSDLHYRLLERHFPPEHVGQLFLAAGQWDQAIAYLGEDIRRGGIEDRSRILLAAVSAMYSAPTKRAAYAYLAHGLKTAYPAMRLRLYDVDEDQAMLVLVQSTVPESQPARARPIPLSAVTRPEVRALTSPHEYDLQPAGRYQLHLLIPIRSSTENSQGLAIVENFATVQNVRRRFEQTIELEGYLRHAARALHNRQESAQLYHAVEQRARDLAQLLALMQQLMSARQTHRQVLDQTLQSALQALQHRAHKGSIYLYDRQTGQLTMEANSGYPLEVQASAHFLPGEGVAGFVYQSGRVWNVADTENDRHYQPFDADTKSHVRSSIGVPLRGRYGLLGVLCLDNTERTSVFDENSEKLLEVFAGQAALWLENIRLAEILSDLTLTTTEVLNLAASDQQAILDKVARRLIHNFRLNGCAIGLYPRRAGEDDIRFVVRQDMGQVPERLPLPQLPPLLHLLPGQRKPLCLADLDTDAPDWHDFFGPTAFTSLVALPLINDLGPYGLLLLASVGRFVPTPEESDLLSTFANQVTIALENQDLYRQVHFELQQRIEDLELANRKLDRARRQEVQIRNARLATGLLHQINNSIANIPELMEELAEALPDEHRTTRVETLLSELSQNALAAYQVSNWLHQFIRLGRPALEPVDIVDLIQETVQDLEGRRPAHVTVEILPHPAVPPLQADRALIKILVENLIQNAFEALPPTQPGRLCIEVTPGAQACRIQFQDNGVGIHPKDRDQLWEWGWTTKRLEGETHNRGLGLFASRQITAAHEGKLELADSLPGAGATFSVELPYAGPRPGAEVVNDL